jgi:hypothetical protein
MLWSEWDRCYRLRAGVVDLFVDRELPPEIFGYLVQDDPLFVALAEQAARTFKGRRYLRLVGKALKIAPDNISTTRRRSIEKLMK